MKNNKPEIQFQINKKIIIGFLKWPKATTKIFWGYKLKFGLLRILETFPVIVCQYLGWIENCRSVVFLISHLWP